MDEPIYLSLVAGRDPATSRTILVTRDPGLLNAFIEALRRQVQDGLEGEEARRVLRFLHPEPEEPQT